MQEKNTTSEWKSEISFETSQRTGIKHSFIAGWKKLKSIPNNLVSSLNQAVLQFIARVGSVWHSTDSVLYLERLVEEKDIRISELKLELESFKTPVLQYEEDRVNPKPISGYEPWSVIKARVAREQREKEKELANKSPEGTN